MKFSGKFLRLSVALIGLISLVSSISAQVGLRKALDQDGDGKADLIVFRPSNNVWYTSKSNGGFTFQQFGLANDDYVVPGDYDGDGKGDVAVWRDSTGVWYYLRSTNGTFVATAFGLTGDEPVARDYDGDLKTDLAVVRRTNGAMIWYVLGSLNGAFRAEQFGLSTDFTAPGDYDGDGKYDLAVQRPGATPASQATFYINRSMLGFTAVGWGLSNDMVAPGDYDGDGKTDIAVVREGNANVPNNLVWSVLRSSDGQASFTSYGLIASDLLAQGDYTGDGKTDVAVWRNTTGTFYVLNSATGASQTLQWGQTDDVPVASYDTH